MHEPQLTPTAQAVLEKRYLVKDETGRPVETPSALFRRVARFIAEAERTWGGDPAAVADVFYSMMARLDFLPNTPCLINAGRENSQGQFSACFVLPVEDNMRSIGKTMVDMMMIHKSGGGTGFDFSGLRPYGDFVKSTTGIASGPVSFMRMYNNVTEEIKQSGARRGANMGILRVDHPDILAFIKCKADVSQIQNFNISVGITDDFMRALDQGASYALVSPRTGAEVGRLAARDVWELIVSQAHATGEPGLFFVDRANRADPLAHVPGYELRATNPCGEVPLCAHNACTLGSINLGNFFEVRDGKRTIDFERLSGTVRHAVRFLDNVLEQNQYPVPEIHETTAAQRKIGLGVMGWADLLAKLEIPYASGKAMRMASNIMGFVNSKAVNASVELAEERGPFPLWDKSRWAEAGDPPRRNSTVTVIAPTGSISIIAGCSSGIEPLFALCQTRRQADMEITDLSAVFEGWLEERPALDSVKEAIRAHVGKHGTLRGCEYVTAEEMARFEIANEIGTKWHVGMQAAFQAHVEDAVSKTINLPNSAGVDEVAAAYRQAWEQGCKGITVYRDGCRPMQTLSVGDGRFKKIESVVAAAQTAAGALARRRIPDDGRRRGQTFTKKTAYGSVHVTINDHPDDGQPFELFCALGKGGSETAAWGEAFGRVMSLMLSTSDDPRRRLVEAVEQLAGIGGGEPTGMGERRIASAADGIAHAIRDYLAEDVVNAKADICPECGQPTLVRASGCLLCSTCGYTKC